MRAVIPLQDLAATSGRLRKAAENQLRVLKDPPERIKNITEELPLILIDDGKKEARTG